MGQDKEGGCCSHENATNTNYDTPSSAVAASAISYQKSSSSNSLRNMDTATTSATASSRKSGLLHRFIDSTFRRFSIEQGYENPPQAEQEEEFHDDDEANDRDDNADDENDAGNDKNIAFHRPSSSHHNRCVLLVTVILVIALVASFAVYIYSTHGRGLGPMLQYTGEENDDFAAAKSGNNADQQRQKLVNKLKSFSTLPPMDHGVVAADHPTCSEIGLSMMRDLNGNAIDAAIATALCLGVANPSSSGIGGGAFILVHADADNYLKNVDKKPQPKYHDARINPKTFVKGTTEKITEVIDCREVAGEKASTTMFEDEGVPSDASLFGGLAIGVPGELRGLELAHARHGRLEWSAVVRPAMELARNGVPVYTHLAHDIVMMQHRQSLHGNGMPTLRKLLTHDDDWKHILKEGQLIKNLKLADTLQAIMEKGSDALYAGTRAEQLAKDIQNAGGILNKQDIELYLPTLRDPVISDNVFGFHVVGVPPPSSGGAVIIGAIRFLAGFATPLASFADTLGIHRMTEAMKHVFAIRMSMGDPAFPIGNDVTNATTHDAVDALIQGSYMEELRQSSYRDDGVLNMSHYGGPRFAQLNDSDGSAHGHDAKEGDRRKRRLQQQQRKRVRRRLADPFGYLEDHGTSHLSVVDGDGNAVAITTSVNAQFGSGIVSESTGVVLNNQMDDFGNPGKANYFGLKPSRANFILPDKKPLSSMSPTMVFQTHSNNSDDGLGDLRLVVGGSGGPKIITAVFQVIVNHLLLGKPLFESMAHPRVHNQLLYHGTSATTVENSIVEPSGLNLQVSNRTKSALTKRGNRLIDIDYAGTVQAVAVDYETGTLEAVCDIRKGGSPVGY